MVESRMAGIRSGSALWGFELADAGRRKIGMVRRDRAVNQAYDDLRTAARQFHHRSEPYYIQHRAHGNQPLAGRTPWTEQGSRSR
jgi:hypothetical protein